MILVAYRHGLRASELVDLRWDQVEFERPRCTSAGSNRARPAPIRSLATNCALCGGYSASRSPSRHSCSRQSAAHRSARPDSLAWLSARAWRPSWRSRRIRTCCATPAATRSPIRATTPARYKPISATKHSAHGAIHRAVADAVQGFLAGVARALVAPGAGRMPRPRMSAFGPKQTKVDFRSQRVCPLMIQSGQLAIYTVGGIISPGNHSHLCFRSEILRKGATVGTAKRIALDA